MAMSAVYGLGVKVHMFSGPLLKHTSSSVQVIKYS